MSVSPPLPADGRALDPAALDQLFREARSATEFAKKEVDDELLDEIWELARLGPTSLNAQPLRLFHFRTPQAVERLLPHVDPRNRDKVRQAPVTTLLAADLHFHRHLPSLFPDGERPRDAFEHGPRAEREKQARFNATLQAGYFLLAARAVGLAAGPMSGFDAPAVTAAFLDTGRTEALLLINLGHPSPTPPQRPRLPRLAAEQVVRRL
ncbi:malonic semialdehyde reductase [Streptomyces viridiviolaceus]